jgi:hypothetical protein
MSVAPSKEGIRSAVGAKYIYIAPTALLFYYIILFLPIYGSDGAKKHFAGGCFLSLGSSDASKKRFKPKFNTSKTIRSPVFGYKGYDANWFDFSGYFD